MIGYACQIFAQTGYGLKTCRLENATNTKLVELCNHNIETLEKMIEYNIENNIKLFRISSDIIPFASHETINFEWQKIYQEKLSLIGEKIRKNNVRVSMHPGQYCILNSPNILVVERTVKELQYHCDFFDLLGVSKKSKMVLHVGGVYAERESATKRFCENYKLLPQSIKQRIVLENDEKTFNINQVLEICEKLEIPAVFDVLHHKINPPENVNKDIECFLVLAKKTWKPEDGKQKIHYSQQQQGAKIGAHSQTIDIDEFMSCYNHCETFSKCDIMLEVKDKNLSALKCIQVVEKAPKTLLEKQHAKYKYYLMAHAQSSYNEARALFGNQKNQEAQNFAYEFYKIVEKAQQTFPTEGSIINTAQHVWGYFKNKASQQTKTRFEKLCEQTKQDVTKSNILFKFLVKQAVTWDETYLIFSYIHLLA